MSVWTLLREPGVGIVLLVSGHIMTLAFAYTAALPISLFTPIDLGSFGLPPVRISIILAMHGLSQAIWLLFVFPPLQRRVRSRES